MLHLSIREEIEKQKSKELIRKLQSEGKTEQGRADLARLAIIKKQREEAAKKREAMMKGEEITAPTWLQILCFTTGHRINSNSISAIFIVLLHILILKNCQKTKDITWYIGCN